MSPRCDTHDSEDPGLAGGVFACPSEVTGLKTKSTVFQVSSTNTNGVDTLGAKLGARWLAAELEFSLLAVVGTLGPSMRTLVPG